MHLLFCGFRNKCKFGWMTVKGGKAQRENFIPENRPQQKTRRVLAQLRRPGNLTLLERNSLDRSDLPLQTPCRLREFVFLVGDHPCDLELIRVNIEESASEGPPLE